MQFTKKLTTKFLILLFVVLFSVYWLGTIIYVSPNNFIRICLADVETFYDKYLFQRWSFFAPPPTSNNRIYFIFKPIDGSKIVGIEILEELYRKKREHAPFNNRYQSIDYILTNSASEINDILAGQNTILKTMNPDSTDVFIFGASREILHKEFENMPGGKTLLNYAKLYYSTVLNTNHDLDSVKISIEVEQIPKFQDRNQILIDTIDMPRMVIYQSRYLSI